MADQVCDTPEWAALASHFSDEAFRWHMRDMFNDDKDRFKQFR